MIVEANVKFQTFKLPLKYPGFKTIRPPVLRNKSVFERQRETQASQLTKCFEDWRMYLGGSPTNLPLYPPL